MSANVNKMIVVGNLTKDPESPFDGGCTFSVACNEKYKNRDGELVESTTYIDVTCSGRLAENCLEYLKKGRQVYIEGKFQTRTWDKDDGTKGYASGCWARDVQFLGGGGGRDSEGASSGGRGGGRRPRGRGVPQGDWK